MTPFTKFSPAPAPAPAPAGGGEPLSASLPGSGTQVGIEREDGSLILDALDDGNYFEFGTNEAFTHEGIETASDAFVKEVSGRITVGNSLGSFYIEGKGGIVDAPSQGEGGQDFATYSFTPGVEVRYGKWEFGLEGNWSQIGEYRDDSGEKVTAHAREIRLDATRAYELGVVFGGLTADFGDAGHMLGHVGGKLPIQFGNNVLLTPSIKQNVAFKGGELLDGEGLLSSEVGIGVKWAPNLLDRDLREGYRGLVLSADLTYTHTGIENVINPGGDEGDLAFAVGFRWQW